MTIEKLMEKYREKIIHTEEELKEVEQNEYVSYIEYVGNAFFVPKGLHMECIYFNDGNGINVYLPKELQKEEDKEEISYSFSIYEDGSIDCRKHSSFDDDDEGEWF